MILSHLLFTMTNRKTLILSMAVQSGQLGCAEDIWGSPVDMENLPFFAIGFHISPCLKIISTNTPGKARSVAEG